VGADDVSAEAQAAATAASSTRDAMRGNGRVSRSSNGKLPSV